MLSWIMQNKTWLFEGSGTYVLTLAVTLIGLVIGWLWSKRKSDAGTGKDEASIASIHQTNSGGGDNVGRDKIVNG